MTSFVLHLPVVLMNYMYVVLPNMFAKFVEAISLDTLKIAALNRKHE